MVAFFSRIVSVLGIVCGIEKTNVVSAESLVFALLLLPFRPLRFGFKNNTLLGGPSTFLVRFDVVVRRTLSRARRVL